MTCVCVGGRVKIWNQTLKVQGPSRPQLLLWPFGPPFGPVDFWILLNFLDFLTLKNGFLAKFWSFSFFTFKMWHLVQKLAFSQFYSKIIIIIIKWSSITTGVLNFNHSSRDQGWHFDSGNFLIKLNSRVVLNGPCDDDYDDLWASLSTVSGSKLQQVASVKFWHSDHPIQRDF